MKKQLLLAISLLGAFSFNDVNAAKDDKAAPWLMMGKNIFQLGASVYLLKNLDDKREVSQKSRYVHGFEKLASMALLATFASGISVNDWNTFKDYCKRIAFFTTLLAGTHAIASHDTIVKKLRKLPYAGAIFTDAEDMNGNEQTSVGAIARYVSVFVLFDLLAKKSDDYTSLDLKSLSIFG